MKTKESAAGAKTAQVTNLKEVQKGKRFPLAKQEKKDVTDVQPIEKVTPVQETTTPVVETPTAPAPVEVQNPLRKVASIEDYKSRIEKLHELTIKHNKLAERLREVELFEIKKEEATASVRLWDGNGASFVSSDPASLFKVLSVIKDSYVTQINEVENQVFDLMTA